MCARLQVDPYVAHVSKRVVAMFEYYSQSIDPDAEDFLRFVSEYLAKKNIKEPKAIVFSDLYGHVKEAIREYLREKDMSKTRNVQG